MDTGNLVLLTTGAAKNKSGSYLCFFVLGSPMIRCLMSVVDLSALWHVKIPGRVVVCVQVSNMPPPWGKCGEADLKYYSFYSVSTCVTECETDYVYKHCGCIDVSMPSGNGQLLLPRSIRIQHKFVTEFINTHRVS